MHTTPIQLRFVDTDKLGHVNNAVYLSYFELARVKYFDDVIAENIDWRKSGLILARVEVDYLIPIFLEDTIVIKSLCIQLGNKSFTISHEVVRKKGDKEEICAKGNSVLVCFDYEKNATISVPDSWRAKIEDHLAGISRA